MAVILMLKMKNILLLAMILHAAIFSARGENYDSLDSVQGDKAYKAYNMRLITRLHSLGQFSYGGRIVADNPVVDLNFSYDRKNWGLQVFKALDTRDHNTPINFTLAVLNKNFHIGKRLTITPSAGFILEQSNTIADHGSDVTLIVTTVYKISKEWMIEHSTLLGNLVLTPEERDWVNRFRCMYSKRHFDFIASVWHNNKVFDPAEYITYGASVFYSRMKLAQGVSVNLGFTGLVMPYSNDLLDYPKKNGLIFTMALVLN